MPIQQIKIKKAGIYTSKIKKLVCPVLWNLQYIVSVENNYLLLLVSSIWFIYCAYLVESYTGLLINLFVWLDIFSYGGTSKKTNIAQILTPS